MLTEQGGIGGGRTITTEDGYVLTLQQRIWDHYITSMATLLKAGDMRQELLQYSVDAWNHRNSASPNKAYFLPEDNSIYLHDALAMLMAHGVKVSKASREFSMDMLDYRTGANTRKTLPAGTWVISTAQPRHLFINSIMERNMAIEDSVMYDISTWSVPLAFNLTAYATTISPTVATTPVTSLPIPAASFEPANSPYAYVMEWKQRHAPAALAAMWEKGYRTRAAKEPFHDGKKSYGEGTIIVLSGHNLDKQDRIREDMKAIASDNQVQIKGYDTGRMASGFDLASTSNRPVKQPRVALMTDPPFDMYSCGQIYFLFDVETRLPVQRIKTSILQQTAIPKFGSRYGYASLLDYDVLILPGGGAGLKDLFQKEQLDQLKAWIENGGVLIAQESAASFFTLDRAKFTNVKLHEPVRDTSSAATYISYAERADYYGLKRVPGAALNATLDVTHPLAFGMDKQVYSLKSGTEALKANPELQTVGRYDPNPETLLSSGYASVENRRHLAGHVFAAVQAMGKGKIVFLVDNPQFRMYWRGPSRMMQNAVMLLPGF
jgi:hypothetical protein